MKGISGIVAATLVLFGLGGCCSHPPQKCAASHRSPDARPVKIPLSTNQSSADDAAMPWSVAGTWHCTHPAWNGTLAIFPDGTFQRNKNDQGHWTLTGVQDHVVLLLAWDRWAAETAVMITPDYFRGKVRDGELEMHRIR